MSSSPRIPPAGSPPRPSWVPSDCDPHSADSLTASHPHRPNLLFPSHFTPLPSHSSGAGPFLTKLSFLLPSGHHVFWESRKHRKRVAQTVDTPDEATIQAQTDRGELSPKRAQSLRSVARAREKLRVPWYARLLPFHPRRIAYWTAVLFDLGSLCFVFSSICAFIPGIYDSEYLNTAMVGWTGFAGSVLFTVGSVLGVAEVLKAPLVALMYPMAHEHERAVDQRAKVSTNTPPTPDATASLVALLRRLDFWVTSVQLVGAVAFNINTLFFSGAFTLTQAQTTGLVDFPDVFASCCFTLSGYLSMLEVTHSALPVTSVHDLAKLDWNITLNNFLGGIGFLINGVLIIYYPNAGQLQPAYPLLIGSLFFQVGSHLQFMEQADTFAKEGNNAGASPQEEESENGVPAKSPYAPENGRQQPPEVEDGGGGGTVEMLSPASDRRVQEAIP